MPFILLVFLFIGIPIIEISLLIRVSSVIGGFNTIVFVIFTAVLGAYLVKQQGLATLAKLQQEADAGRVPAQQIVEGVALLVAGAVLLTPGFATDALGFALLIPVVRIAIIKWVVGKGIKGSAGFQSAYQYRSDTYPDPTSHEAQSSTVIEGEYTSPQDKQK